MLTNNISKSKLSGKNIGIYFGTFAPLHTGHQQQIYKCASLNGGVLLVVSGYDNDRGAQIGLPLEKRFRYLREAFNDEENIKVSMLNENDLPEMPNGWDEWANRLFELIHHNTLERDLSVTFYVGELEYAAELKKRFPADVINMLLKLLTDMIFHYQPHKLEKIRRNTGLTLIASLEDIFRKL